MTSHAQSRTVFKPGNVPDTVALEFRIAFTRVGGNALMLQQAIERPALMASLIQDVRRLRFQYSEAWLKQARGFRILEGDSCNVSLGQLHEFMVAFGRAGGDANVLQTLIVNMNVMNDFVIFLRQDVAEMAADFVPSIAVDEKALKIFKVDEFFGIGKAAEVFDIRSDDQALKPFQILPEGYENHAKSHFLVADFGFSIADLFAIFPEVFSGNRYWVNSEFAHQRIEPRWQLVRKEAIGQSEGLSYEGQLTKRNCGFEAVPSARLMIYCAVAMYMAHGLEILRGRYVRTRDVPFGNEDCQVIVGLHPLVINHIPDNQCRGDVGLAGFVFRHISFGDHALFEQSEERGGEPHPVTRRFARSCVRESHVVAELPGVDIGIGAINIQP